ncbi:hypothetical protein LZ31DRAFT_181984 [Colletotrichum somersetense]|nr:hypothetical protein LZ31DRAFT_181984 [Colletotrichum somersetense]
MIIVSTYLTSWSEPPRVGRGPPCPQAHADPVFLTITTVPAPDQAKVPLPGPAGPGPRGKEQADSPQRSGRGGASSSSPFQPLISIVRYTAVLTNGTGLKSGGNGSEHAMGLARQRGSSVYQPPQPCLCFCLCVCVCARLATDHETDNDWPWSLTRHMCRFGVTPSPDTVSGRS